MASRRRKEVASPIALEKPRRGRPRKAEPAPEYELTDKGKAALSDLNGHANVSLNGAAPKASASSKESSVLRGPSDMGDGQLYFSAHDRLLYENKQLLVKSGLQNIALKRLEIAQMRSQFEDRMRQAQTDLANVTNDAKAAEAELRSIQEEIQRVYSVDLQKIAYDPDTGRISIPPAE